MSIINFQSALNALANNWDTSKNEQVAGMDANCPHCGVYASFIEINRTNINAGAIVSAFGKDSLGWHLIQLQCPACKELLVVATAYQKSTTSNANILQLQLLWPPLVRPNRAPEDLDVGSRKDYDEARHVLQTSPAAAALLARRCLQHVIRTKLNIKCRTLYEEIEEAVKHNILSDSTRKALHHIRDIGNFAAHPTSCSNDKDAINEAVVIIDVSLEEAVYTIEVLELLFDDLYRTPLRIQKMNESINTKKCITK